MADGTGKSAPLEHEEFRRYGGAPSNPDEVTAFSLEIDREKGAGIAKYFLYELKTSLA